MSVRIDPIVIDWNYKRSSLDTKEREQDHFIASVASTLFKGMAYLYIAFASLSLVTTSVTVGPPLGFALAAAAASFAFHQMAEMSDPNQIIAIGQEAERIIYHSSNWPLVLKTFRRAESYGALTVEDLNRIYFDRRLAALNLLQFWEQHGQNALLDNTNREKICFKLYEALDAFNGSYNEWENQYSGLVALAGFPPEVVVSSILSRQIAKNGSFAVFAERSLESSYSAGSPAVKNALFEPLH